MKISNIVANILERHIKIRNMEKPLVKEDGYKVVFEFNYGYLIVDDEDGVIMSNNKIKDRNVYIETGLWDIFAMRFKFPLEYTSKVSGRIYHT